MNQEYRMNRSLLLPVIALFTSTAMAADHFVNAPASIQAAMNAAAPGDRILVGPGVYYEVIDFQGKQLEVIGTGGPNLTILDGSGFNSTVVRATSGEALGTTLQGFTLTNGAGQPFPSSYGYDYYGGGAHVGGAAQLLISDCVITNNGWGTGTFGGGVHCGGDGSHVDLVRCVINNNRAWASGGATLVDWYATMSFDSCTVYGNSSNNFFGHQGGISMANYGTVVVHNSIVWGNEGNEIDAFAFPYNQGTHADVSFCCVEGGYSGSSNINSNPLFANVTDFTLSSGSPCIDAGDMSSGLDPDGTAPDLGARWAGWSGAPTAVEYCDPKLNSQGCEPGLTASGESTLGGVDDFHVIASNLRNNQFAALFFSFGPADVPFSGGMRCVAAPYSRMIPSYTGGTPYPGADCTGTLDLHLDHTTLSAMGGPGTQVFMQIWFRDPGHPDGTNMGLTGGLCVTLSS
jgi:hypothetical protein